MIRAFEIAGTRVELSLPDGAIAEALKRAFEPFRSDPTRCDRRIEVKFSEEGANLPPQTLIGHLESHRAGWQVRGDGYLAQLSADLTSTILETVRSRTPIDNLIKLIVAEDVVRRGGILVHCVAVAHEGAAALFPGRSGAGKSTLGKWCGHGGLQLVADEMVAMLPTDDGAELFGTPWNVGFPRRARLTMLGLLRHGPRHVAETESKTDVMRELLGNTLFPDADPAKRGAVFRQASALVNATRCVRLTFARDVGVAAVVREALVSAATSPPQVR